MNKQAATTTTTTLPHTHSVAGKSRQQTAFYDVLTQLTLQQLRQRASQRS